jgi:hypothetical protein
MIREEHMDLFPNETLDLTGVTSVANGIGAVLDFRQEGNFKVPTYDIKIKVAETATSTGAPTLALELQSSEDNVSWKTILTGKTLALADIVADAEILATTVPKTANQYLRVVAKNATVGTTFTAGKLFGTVLPRY